MASASGNQAEQPARHFRETGSSARAWLHRAGQYRAPLWLSCVLVALTCVCLLASTMTLWLDATLLNSDQFMALVTPLGRDPQVIASVSGYVADQAVAALDIPGRTASVLPPRGQFLLAPLEQRVHDYIQSQTADFLSSDEMQAKWSAVERSAHAELVAALRGQSSTVTIEHGTLTVDLLPLIAASLSRLRTADPGLILSRVPIPDLSSAQSPEQQRRELSQALGVQLAPDFGMVAVLHTDALDTAQRIVTALDTLRVVLPILTLALAAAAIWSIADWRRALMLLGMGTAAGALVAIPLAHLLLDQIAASATAVRVRPVVERLTVMLWASLFELLVGVLIVAALVALAAYLAGKLPPCRPTTEPTHAADSP